MANETVCQTPGSFYHIHISPSNVSVQIDFPHPIHLSKEEAELTETNIHNALELVLARYFPNKSLSKFR